MIKHKLIKKGSIAHSLISPVNYPHNFIPVKVVIKDIKFDEYNPLYLVKIIKFYDNIYYLREYFIDNKFQNAFDKKARPFYIKNVKTVDELQNFIDSEDSRFYVVVDSIHTMRYKNEMQELFNKMQDFLIFRNLDNFREMSTRSFYSGKFKISSGIEFFNRLKRMLSDIIVDQKMTWDDFKNLF